MTYGAQKANQKNPYIRSKVWVKHRKPLSWFEEEQNRYRETYEETGEEPSWLGEMIFGDPNQEANQPYEYDFNIEGFLLDKLDTFIDRVIWGAQKDDHDDINLF